MHRLVSFLCALLVATGITAQTAVAHTHLSKSAAFPVTIVDDHGTKVHLTKAPQRIVSLDPRDTETLFAVGAEAKVVGDGGQYVEGAAGISRAFKYPSEWPSNWGRDYPVRSKTLPHVEGGCCGTHFNVETITSLHPDLVVAPYSKTELDTFQQLRDVGFKVVILDPGNLKQILGDITLAGKFTGNRAKATKVVGEMKAQLASVKRAARRAKKTPRVYYEIDATNPTQPFTAGPGTFIDEAIHLVHGQNVADAASTCSGTLCYPQFSLEALVRLDPQIILLGDAGYGTSPADVKARGGWETINAVKSGKIYPFDDELISRAGPRIVVGIRGLAKAIHPEVFKKK
jgi:iron complex transport system substrate-binding protein